MNQLLIIVPLLYALFFIHIRKKYTTKKYLISAMPFLLEILIFINHSKFVHYGFSGFYTYSLLLGLVAIIIICSVKPKNIVLKFFQLGFSFFVFHLFIMFTSYI